jgi:NAD(P)-dependent dehydrogenase (short-subunit alcohol dehydrogenase family)
MGAIDELDAEGFRKTVDVHLLGTFLGIKQAAR